MANITLNGTRVIYKENDKEVTLKLSNNGKGPVLAQSWIDKGDVTKSPEQIQVPFTLLPPINRINAGKSQTLRISYTASPALPKDRESVYWLNVLEIPPVKKDTPANRLQVAFRTRIKLFYRPTNIGDADKATAAAEKLQWSSTKEGLQARNSSPFFVSLASVTVDNGSSAEGKMVPPFGQVIFNDANSKKSHHNSHISYEYINDWGAVESVKSNAN